MQVLYLPPGSEYLVYKPFKYGRLNVQKEGVDNENHSLSFVLSILEDLWTKAIEDYLEIEKKNFKVSPPH